MSCPTCARPLVRFGHYCPACGARVIDGDPAEDIPATARILCVACGKPGPPGGRYCTECGRALSTHAFEDLGAADACIADERRMVTVLQADLCGFTGIVEALSPDSTKRVVEQFFDMLTWEVARFGGRVLAYIGDAMVVVFGLRISDKDDPVWAVRAALSVRNLTVTFSRPELETIGARFHLRIGIDTGPVLVSHGVPAPSFGVLPITHPMFPEPVAGLDRGNRLGIDGAPVLNAAVLERNAPEDGILIGPTTAAFVAERFALEPVSGCGRSVVYRVMGIRQSSGATPSSLMEPLHRDVATHVGSAACLDADAGCTVAGLECCALQFQVPPPPSVFQRVQPTLDRLTWDEKRIVRLAAVVGRRFWVELLGRMVGGLVGTVVRRLEEMSFVARVAESSVSGATEFRFTSAATQWVAYHGYSRRDRWWTHRIVARWLRERRGAGSSLLAISASHLAAGGDGGAAVDWLLDGVEAEEGEVMRRLWYLGCAGRIVRAFGDGSPAWGSRSARYMALAERVAADVGRDA